MAPRTTTSMLQRLRRATPEQAARMLRHASALDLHSVGLLADDIEPMDPEVRDVYYRERRLRCICNTSIQDARSAIRRETDQQTLRTALAREQRGQRRQGLIASLRRRIRETQETD